MLPVLLVSLSLVRLSLQDSGTQQNEFLLPTINQVWSQGSQQTIQWVTNITTDYTVGLWQQWPSDNGAFFINTIHTSGSNSAGTMTFTWTVQTYNASITYSPRFFLWLGKDQPVVFSSPYFEILPADIGSSASTPSEAPSSTPTATNTLTAATATIATFTSITFPSSAGTLMLTSSLPSAAMFTSDKTTLVVSATSASNSSVNDSSAAQVPFSTSAVQPTAATPSQTSNRDTSNASATAARIDLGVGLGLGALLLLLVVVIGLLLFRRRRRSGASDIAPPYELYDGKGGPSELHGSRLDYRDSKGPFARQQFKLHEVGGNRSPVEIE